MPAKIHLASGLVKSYKRLNSVPMSVSLRVNLIAGVLSSLSVDDVLCGLLLEIGSFLYLYLSLVTEEVQN